VACGLDGWSSVPGQKLRKFLNKTNQVGLHNLTVCLVPATCFGQYTDHLQLVQYLKLKLNCEAYKRLVEIDRRFRGVYSIIRATNLHTRCRENLNSHV
jgi:hypothetical protein